MQLILPRLLNVTSRQLRISLTGVMQSSYGLPDRRERLLADFEQPVKVIRRLKQRAKHGDSGGKSNDEPSHARYQPGNQYCESEKSRLHSICNSLNDERGTGGQSRLARLLGWHHSTIWRKLNGKSKITSSDALAIIAATEAELSKTDIMIKSGEIDAYFSGRPCCAMAQTRRSPKCCARAAGR